MARPSLLGAEAALERLGPGSGWTAAEGRDALSKTFEFASFEAAFGWMTRIALQAERLDHHPEWSNIYNRVVVTLTTHDVGGVTDLDVILAAAMDRAR